MPQQPDARHRLLRAADELFAADGFTGTPVDAVLRRAGVAPATLYAHFSSKAGLLAAVLTDRLAEWDRLWTEAVEAAGGDRARLLAVFDAVEVFRARATPSRWCAFLDAAAGAPAGDPTAGAALASDTALLRGRLTELARPLAGDRAMELAEHLVVVVTGMLAMQLRADADAAARPRPGPHRQAPGRLTGRSSEERRGCAIAHGRCRAGRGLRVLDGRTEPIRWPGTWSR